jgi:Secretion system C-terminal sorting domain
MSGSSIVYTGGLHQYSINASLPQGATQYEWWLPYPYDTVTTFDYFGQNWQKYEGSTGNGLTVFTGYSKTNGLMQVMPKNQCGCGGGIMKYVRHRISGSGGHTGGGIPRLALKGEFMTLNIFPNPAKDILNIDLKDSNNNLSQETEVSIEMYDIQGKKVKQMSEKTNKFSLDIRDLSKGIYVLKVQIEDTFETHKIIIE